MHDDAIGIKADGAFNPKDIPHHAPNAKVDEMRIGLGQTIA
jgi:hypothetical protein